MTEPAKFPPIQLQDGKSPEWTCETCGGDALWCKCNRSSSSSSDSPVGAPGSTPQDWIAELEPAFRNPEVVALNFYTFSGTLTATVTRSEYLAARALKSVAPGTGETPEREALQKLAALAMTAQSDPHAPAATYRASLIEICNQALACLDKFAGVVPPHASQKLEVDDLEWLRLELTALPVYAASRDDDPHGPGFRREHVKGVLDRLRERVTERAAVPPHASQPMSLEEKHDEKDARIGHDG